MKRSFAVVIALLNEGLDVARAELPNKPARNTPRPPRRGRPPLPVPAA